MIYLWIFQFPLIIPIFFLLCVLFLLILPLTVEPESTGMALVMILVGVPVYLIFVKWKNKPKSWNNFFGEFKKESLVREIFLDYDYLIFLDLNTDILY